MKSFRLVRRLLSASLVGVPLVGLLWLGSCAQRPEKSDTVEAQISEADQKRLP